jgi:exonuclease SbcD
MSNFPLKKPGSIRLIAAADLHLGRRISLPDVLENSLLTPEGAWERLVDIVIDPMSEVDALLLAGDLFDKEEDILEAPYYFEKGIRRLGEENKPVIAIAGNHDWRSLRRRHRFLCFDHVHILGLNGDWESCDLEFNSRIIRFEGWSFPSSQYWKNPLETLPSASYGITTIGLLHGDWEGAPNSPYAPFSLKQLVTSGRQAWVLGHIHIPKILSENPHIISCGTLQGLDSSEQGERGAFLIDIGKDGEIEVQMIPLAALRWDTVSLDITDLQESHYEFSLQQILESNLPKVLRCISLELIWKGKLDDPQKKEILKGFEGTYIQLKTPHGFIDCHIRKSTLDLRPNIDLKILAQEQSIIGQVARQILQLENGEEQKRLRELFAKEASAYPHFSLDFDQSELRSQSYEVLFDLLEQKELQG